MLRELAVVAGMGLALGVTVSVAAAVREVWAIGVAAAAVGAGMMAAGWGAVRRG
jgi:hypothetical protein